MFGSVKKPSVERILRVVCGRSDGRTDGPGVQASANPVGSRYNPSMSVIDNIQLPPTLLSRFDLIFLVLDKPNPETDRRLARHLVSLHFKARSHGSTRIPHGYSRAAAASFCLFHPNTAMSYEPAFFTRRDCLEPAFPFTTNVCNRLNHRECTGYSMNKQSHRRRLHRVNHRVCRSFYTASV